MPTLGGYIGEIEVETRGKSRIWFAMTFSLNNVSKDWIRLDGERAYFTMNLEDEDESRYRAQLELLRDAMVHELYVVTSYEGPLSFNKYADDDAYEATGIRVFRKDVDR